MNVLMHGCNGRMGQVITALASHSEDFHIVCGVDTDIDKFRNPYPVYTDLSKVTEQVDVVIDFSNHTCISSLLHYGVEKKVGLVLCTTGYTQEERMQFVEASTQISVFNTGNLSIGINLLQSLAKAAALKLYEDFDIEIIERHHNQKLDSPSGTALMLADSINSVLPEQLSYTYERHSKMEKRNQRELGIHSIRGGAIVGEHEVLFAGAGETITLTHTALSRDVFAVGAIRAAKFLYQKAPGLYDMQHVIEA